MVCLHDFFLLAIIGYFLSLVAIVILSPVAFETFSNPIGGYLFELDGDLK